jgi:hypothetical protein
MRKIAIGLVVALALSIAGGAMAQAAPWSAPAYGQPQGKTVTVEGKLALINGIIGVKSGNKTYYTPMIGRLSGFVEGIKEGATVKIEGYEYPIAAAPEYSRLMVTKLTVGGKSYDFGQFAHGGMGGGRRGGMMGGGRW